MNLADPCGSFLRLRTRSGKSLLLERGIEAPEPAIGAVHNPHERIGFNDRYSSDHADLRFLIVRANRFSSRSRSWKNASRLWGSNGACCGACMGGAATAPNCRSEDSGMSQSFPSRRAPGIRPSRHRRRTDSSEYGVKAENSAVESCRMYRSCIFIVVPIKMGDGTAIPSPHVYAFTVL
jgi:hypothetical protein